MTRCTARPETSTRLANNTIPSANLRVTPGFVMARLHAFVPHEEIEAVARPPAGVITWALFDHPTVEGFVEQAYWAILKRAPDPDGGPHYSRRLAEGSLTRFELANALRRSEEGRSHRSRIVGLGLRLHLMTAHRRDARLERWLRRLDGAAGRGRG
jgi:hypothetical protein